MMAAFSRNGIKWEDVSSAHPCQKCNGDSWCTRSTDGNWLNCRRYNDGTAKTKKDSEGDEYHSYCLNPELLKGEYVEPKFSPADGDGKCADADTLNKVYDAILTRLSLAPDHESQLKRRGLKSGLMAAGYRSWPLQGRALLARKLIEAGLESHFPKVPGFVQREGNEGRKYWTFAGSPGLLIPSLDVEGRIVKFLIRPDDSKKSGGKYISLSSKKHGGPGPGSPIHVPRFDGDKAVVRITEGALKANVATVLSNMLTIGLPSAVASKSAARVLRQLGCTTARLAFDADARRNLHVARALKSLAGTLRNKGFVVELEVWDEADGKGIDDLLNAGKTARVLTETAVFEEIEIIVTAATEAARQYGMRGAAPPHCDDHQHQSNTWNGPSITVDVDEGRVNTEAIKALKNEQHIFQRSNMLVYVLRDAACARNIFRPPGSPRITPLPNPRLREMMADNARWLLEKQTKEGVEYILIHPPDWSVTAVAARGHYDGIRHLETVVEVPTLRPDGTVIEQPGWDPATGLLYEPRIEFPPVPQSPTKADAFTAADMLCDLLCDFPTAGSEHLVAWLAALLTPMARFAFAGPAPLFLFTANTPGTGKTLLASMIAEIVEGREMARTPYPPKDEEMAKTVTAVALAGDRMILLDNIDASTPLGCASLDAALTATSWRSRILGISQMTPDLPLFVTWYASGNNVTLRGDVHRRVIPCRLESGEEHPEQRSGFKYADLLGHVRANRAALVLAALTILRGYFVAGRPVMKLPAFGSFEGWSGLVRAAVYWATDRDPCATRERVTEGDDALSTLAALLAGWAELPNGTGVGVTVAEALRAVKGHRDKHQALFDALMNWSHNDELPSPRKIGFKLRALRGRVLGGKAFYGTPNRDGVIPWRVAAPS